MMNNDSIQRRFFQGPLLGVLVMATGVAVLIGWGFDIPSLKSLLPGFVTMKANTAVGFVLAGLSLALLGRALRSGWSRWLSQACAGISALLGLLTLGEYLLGIDLGIDQLLFREPAGAVGTLAPGRMATATAVNFILLGSALWLAGFRRTIPAAQRLSLLGGLMGLLPLSGYLYGAPNLYGMGHYTQMAVHTTVAFILLSVGVLFMYPTEGLMRTVTRDTLGGWLLRRLAPFVVAVPLALGWILVRSEQGGYIEGVFGVALMMVVVMLLLSGVIWRIARALNRIDIARRRAEADLAENEERIRATLYGIGDGVISTDTAGRVMRMNPVAEQLTGWTEGEASGKTLNEICHIVNEQTRLGAEDPVAQVLRDGHVAGLANPTVLIARDGKERLIANSGAPIRDRQGAITGVVLVFRDRTAERAAQDAARQSEERLQRLVELAPIPMSFIGREGTVNYLNDRFVKVLGYSRDDIPTLSQWWSLACPDESYRRHVMQTWEAAVQKAAQTGTDIESAEYTVTCKDGAVRVMAVSGVVLQDSLLVTFFDVTERNQAGKQMQEAMAETRRLLETAEQSRRILLSVAEDQRRSDVALRESEERFRKVFDEGQIGMALTDSDYRYMRANAVFCRMLGCTEEDLKSRKFTEVTHPDDVDEDLLQAQKLKKGEILSYRREKRYLRKDQTVVWGAVAVSALRDREGRYLYAVAMIEDITERKQAEDAKQRVDEALRESNRQLEAALDEVKRTQSLIVQQERLSALGKMASGIAHDFNNLLVPLLGYSEILLNDPDILNDRVEAREMLTDMHTAAKDGRDLVKRLREFYRPDEVIELKETDLAQLVKEALSLTAPRWKPQARAEGAAIRVVVEAGDLPMIPCGQAQIREAIMNLIFNAVDAMPRGGTLTLRTALREDRVMVRVSDTGVGMSEEVQRRCFEPFFSTKGQKGTGMGLSMVYGVVQRHGGTVEIESEVGKGTTAMISLPLNARGSQEAGSPAVVSKPIRPLHILTVDDEMWSLSLLSHYLTSDGHTVETANGGGLGIDKLKTGRFDLVITDRAMPDMSGDRVAKAVQERWPGTPVILLTGFGDIMHEQGEQPEGVTVVLGKPVTHAELRKAIEKVIP